MHSRTYRTWPSRTKFIYSNCTVVRYHLPRYLLPHHRTVPIAGDTDWAPMKWISIIHALTDDRISSSSATMQSHTTCHKVIHAFKFKCTAADAQAMPNRLGFALHTSVGLRTFWNLLTDYQLVVAGGLVSCWVIGGESHVLSVGEVESQIAQKNQCKSSTGIRWHQNHKFLGRCWPPVETISFQFVKEDRYGKY